MVSGQLTVDSGQQSAFSTQHPVLGGRIEGWEQRLDAVIENARSRPYELGTHDCFSLACTVQAALTGVDRWPEFSGYRSKREALARIAEHGSTFEQAGDWFFGGGHVDMRLARRGDIVALRTEDGQKHLGVCLGDRVACLLADGLGFIPPSACLCAWRIG